VNPLGINGWPGNYLQPGTATTSGVTGTAAGNPASNPQIEVGVAPPGNPLGIVSPVTATKYVQPQDQARPTPPPSVISLMAEGLLVPGPAAPPAYTQPPDVKNPLVTGIVPTPSNPLALNSGVAAAPYAQPNTRNPNNPDVTVIPVVNGDVLKLGDQARVPYGQPQDPAKPATVVSAVSSSTGIVLLE
jgi:hypothetical protein